MLADLKVVQPDSVFLAGFWESWVAGWVVAVKIDTWRWDRKFEDNLAFVRQRFFRSPMLPLVRHLAR